MKLTNCFWIFDWSIKQRTNESETRIEKRRRRRHFSVLNEKMSKFELIEIKLKLNRFIFFRGSFISNEYLAALITIFILLIAYYSQLIQSNLPRHYNIPDPGWLNEFSFNSINFPFSKFDLDCTGVFNLCTDSDKERLGKQAIQYLHQQIDDDKDGLIEISESSDVNQSILRMFYFDFDQNLF